MHSKYSNAAHQFVQAPNIFGKHHERLLRHYCPNCGRKNNEKRNRNATCCISYGQEFFSWQLSFWSSFHISNQFLFTTIFVILHKLLHLKNLMLQKTQQTQQKTQHVAPHLVRNFFPDNFHFGHLSISPTVFVLKTSSEKCYSKTKKKKLSFGIDQNSVY